jgi:hypothetical protein
MDGGLNEYKELRDQLERTIALYEDGPHKTRDGNRDTTGETLAECYAKLREIEALIAKIEAGNA